MVEGIIPLFDVVGTIGFLVAAVIGVRNYRETDIERTFWGIFTLVAAGGFLWVGLVSIEWFGIEGETMDALSTSLQAVVVGVFSAGSIGTLAIVQDLKDSRADVREQRREAEQAREEAETISEQNSSEMANVSAAAGEQTSSLTQIADSIQAVSRQADELRGLLEEFRLGHEEPPAGGSDPAAHTGAEGTAAPDGGDFEFEERNDP